MEYITVLETEAVLSRCERVPALSNEGLVDLSSAPSPRNVSGLMASGGLIAVLGLSHRKTLTGLLQADINLSLTEAQDSSRSPPLRP